MEKESAVDLLERLATWIGRNVIDVLGYEVAVLRGMQKTLVRYRPVVIFEYEEWAWKQANVLPSDAMALLQACGYELFRLDAAAGAPIRPLDLSRPLPAHIDLMAMHPASRSARL